MKIKISFVCLVFSCVPLCLTQCFFCVCLCFSSYAVTRLFGAVITTRTYIMVEDLGLVARTRSFVILICFISFTLYDLSFRGFVFML